MTVCNPKTCLKNANAMIEYTWEGKTIKEYIGKIAVILESKMAAIEWLLKMAPTPVLKLRL